MFQAAAAGTVAELSVHLEDLALLCINAAEVNIYKPPTAVGTSAGFLQALMKGAATRREVAIAMKEMVLVKTKQCLVLMVKGAEWNSVLCATDAWILSCKRDNATQKMQALVMGHSDRVKVADLLRNHQLKLMRHAMNLVLHHHQVTALVSATAAWAEAQFRESAAVALQAGLRGFASRAETAAELQRYFVEKTRVAGLLLWRGAEYGMALHAVETWVDMWQRDVALRIVQAGIKGWAARAEACRLEDLKNMKLAMMVFLKGSEAAKMWDKLILWAVSCRRASAAQLVLAGLRGRAARVEARQMATEVLQDAMRRVILFIIKGEEMQALKTAVETFRGGWHEAKKQHAMRRVILFISKGEEMQALRTAITGFRGGWIAAKKQHAMRRVILFISKGEEMQALRTAIEAARGGWIAAKKQNAMRRVILFISKGEEMQALRTAIEEASAGWRGAKREATKHNTMRRVTLLIVKREEMQALTSAVEGLIEGWVTDIAAKMVQAAVRGAHYTIMPMH